MYLSNLSIHSVCTKIKQKQNFIYIFELENVAALTHKSNSYNANSVQHVQVLLKTTHTINRPDYAKTVMNQCSQHQFCSGSHMSKAIFLYVRDRLVIIPLN